MQAPSFKTVLPYALVVFFGYVGFAMPLPMLPEMFLDAHVGILPTSFSSQLKTLLLGIVMSAYPLGQLIGAPILGKASDLFGRKRVILVSLLGSTLGYLFTAFSTNRSSILGLFLGLFFCGLCEGNVAIAQSVIADLSPPEHKDHKVSQFGWINIFICFAFIIGPILGGQLSGLFSFATPFWIAALMTVIGVAIILLFSKETKKLEDRPLKESYLASFRKSLQQKSLCRAYLVNFFLALGYFSYFRFLPVYIESTFNLGTTMLGYIIAYGSVIFALFSFFFLKPLSKRFSTPRLLTFFAASLALTFLVVLGPNSPWGLLWTIPLVDLCIAVVMTHGTLLVSDASDERFQGQAFGLLTSVQVLAEIFTGLGGGCFAAYHPSLPMIIGACMLLVSSLILLASKKKEKHPHSFLKK